MDMTTYAAVQRPEEMSSPTAAFIVAPAFGIIGLSTSAQRCTARPPTLRGVSCRAPFRMSAADGPTSDQERPSTDPSPAATPTSDDSDTADASDEDEADSPVMLGPTQAPTKAGVSSANLSGQDAALIEASYNADVGAITAALDAGADVNAADVNGRTSLHFCAGNGIRTLVERLAGMGAEINKQDVMGFTPLHMAAGYKMVDSVRALIELDADANLTAQDGRLAVEVAEDLLKQTPKRRFFMPNEAYTRLEEIVEILDGATEVEEDAEEEGEGGAGAKLGPGEVRTEQVGDTKVVVRVKTKEEVTDDEKARPEVNMDDVKVTIRVKPKDS